MAGVINGLPYPTGTDLVVNGDNAIEALARAINGNPANVAGTLIPIAYGSGWAALGNGIRYQLINGWVWLNGRASRASGSSATIGSVPAAFAPLPTFWVPCNGDSVIAVASSGAITLDSGVAAGAFNLFVSAAWPARPAAAAATGPGATQLPNFDATEDPDQSLPEGPEND